jgi:GH25 family lysozyme M1 (1,4-beta-N-acetylmuramidase)
VSHYDWDRGLVDLQAAVADGVTFATHKVSEGSTYADPLFDDFAARARYTLPLSGGYCVNRRGDQVSQVDWFLQRLDAGAPWWRDGPFIIQLDCERWSNKDGVYAYEPSLSEIHAWCDYFVQRTDGRWTPIVYAPKWVYGDTLAGLRYPLWASSYGTNPDLPYRQAYPGDGSSRWAAYSGITPTILQYGSRTTIGAQTICDANAFRGTLDELRTLVTGDAMSWADRFENPGAPGTDASAADYLRFANNYAFQAMNASSAALALLEKIAGQLGLSVEELAEVKAAAEAGAKAGVLGSVDELVAAFVAALPNDVASREDVVSALREVLIRGVEPV